MYICVLQEYGGTGSSIFHEPDFINYVFVPRMGEITRQITVEAGGSLEVNTYVVGYPMDLEITSSQADGSQPEVHERKTLQHPDSHITVHDNSTYNPSETRVYTVKWRNAARLQARYVAHMLVLRDPSGQIVSPLASIEAPFHEETKA